jgi:hypothetical protein
MVTLGTSRWLGWHLIPSKDKKIVKKNREVWEEEIFAKHRWGRLPLWFGSHTSAAKKEHSQLKKLWKRSHPLDGESHRIIEQIISLEICNWRLEQSILALCKAIGTNKPSRMGIGHMASVTTKRWMKIWSYYLASRKWLVGDTRTGYTPLLTQCDPEGRIENHIFEMLGKKNEVKKLYVRRFLLCMEYWFDGCPEKISPTRIVEEKRIEEEIRKKNKGERILESFHLNGIGKLEFCHHKLFRRYDIILSSIGEVKWRAKMGERKIDGLIRADEMEKYLSSLESWIESGGRLGKNKRNRLKKKIFTLLGESNSKKIFLASLLTSLLRSQQIAAIELAERRAKK